MSISHAKLHLSQIFSIIVVRNLQSVFFCKQTTIFIHRIIINKKKKILHSLTATKPSNEYKILSNKIQIKP